MGRSQLRKRSNQGLDSSNYTDITSSYRPKPSSSTQPTAPTGTLGGANVLTAAALPTFTGGAGGTPTVTRQWLRHFDPITGQTGATYTQVNAQDAGKRIRVRYIASTRLGVTWVDSAPTGVIP